MILCSLVSTIVLLILLVIVEQRTPYPMFDLTLFRNPIFIGASIPPLVLSISFWGPFLYFPLYYQGILHYSSLQAGLAVLPFAVPMFLMGPVGAHLATRIPSSLLLSGGELLIGLGCLWMAFAVPDSTWVVFLGGSLLAGIGEGLINGEMSNVAMSVVSPDRSGMASGINGTIRQVGVALGFAGLGSILALQTTQFFFNGIERFPVTSAHRVQLAKLITTGSIWSATIQLPAGMQMTFAHFASESFFAGLHAILVVAAIIAIVGSVVTFLLMHRQGEFAPQQTIPVSLSERPAQEQALPITTFVIGFCFLH